MIAKVKSVSDQQIYDNVGVDARDVACPGSEMGVEFLNWFFWVSLNLAEYITQFFST